MRLFEDLYLDVNTAAEWLDVEYSTDRGSGNDGVGADTLVMGDAHLASLTVGKRLLCLTHVYWFV